MLRIVLAYLLLCFSLTVFGAHGTEITEGEALVISCFAAMVVMEEFTKG